jgi:hypothetical protein
MFFLAYLDWRVFKLTPTTLCSGALVGVKTGKTRQLRGWLVKERTHRTCGQAESRLFDQETEWKKYRAIDGGYVEF